MLHNIKQEYGIKILYACEAGSRAWGFESSDSDYDIRFIYKHDLPWYLDLEQNRDNIDPPIKDGVDIVGWDLDKALKLLRKGNATLYEWLNSPIIYEKDDDFVKSLRDIMKTYYSKTAAHYSYKNMAFNEYQENLIGDTVVVKKYLYVLRPLLACNWIERLDTYIPVLFDSLVEEICTGKLKSEIRVLVNEKKAGHELGVGKRRGVLDSYILGELTRLRNKTTFTADQRFNDIKPLNKLFYDTIK